jgi:hypothetical protein
MHSNTAVCSENSATCIRIKIAFKSHTFWCRITLEVLRVVGEQYYLKTKEIFLFCKWPSLYFSLQFSCFYLIPYHLFYRIFYLFWVYMYKQPLLTRVFEFRLNPWRFLTFTQLHLFRSSAVFNRIDFSGNNDFTVTGKSFFFLEVMIRLNFSMRVAEPASHARSNLTWLCGSFFFCVCVALLPNAG